MFNFSKETVFCTRNRHKQKKYNENNENIPKISLENTVFIICRIVFRHGRRQEKYRLQNLVLAGAEEEYNG